MADYRVRLSVEAFKALQREAEKNGITNRQAASRIVLAALCPAGAPQAQEHGLLAFGAEFVRLWETELAPRGFRRVTERQLLGTHRERLQKLHDYLSGNQADLTEWINRVVQSDFCCGRTAKRDRPADLAWLLDNCAKIWEEPARSAVAVIHPQRPVTPLDAVLRAAELRRNAYLAQEGA